MIIRGTTPTHTFTLPMDSALVDKVRIIYAQTGKPIIKIDSDRISLSENKISCKLTQEETFSLDCKKHCDIQLRVLTTDGDVFASYIIKTDVSSCLDEEVLA